MEEKVGTDLRKKGKESFFNWRRRVILDLSDGTIKDRGSSQVE